MDSLFLQKCEACKAGAEKLTEENCLNLLKDMPKWELLTQDGVNKIQRVFPFKDFISAFGFAEKVKNLAEENAHHPAILIEWGRVTIGWWTHTINGLHMNDFIMASKVNQIDDNEAKSE